MDVTAPHAPARVVAVRLPAAAVLGLLVGVGCAVRMLLGAWHEPHYFPDEYLYAELARSLAETGLPRVRGELAHFPGLLQPLLTAPLWLPGDPVLALRGTQALHALAMSLGAVPVFLTARLLRLSPPVALACAAVSLAAPGLAYGAFVLSDPFGYLLALCALWAGVRALERPSPRREVAFLALGGLAAATRVQYTVLLGGFVVAAALLDRGRAARRFPLTAGAVALAAAAIAALGPAGLLGTYWEGTRGGLDAVGAAAWLPIDALLLAYGVGWALAPGALVGLALAAGAARSRVERAFGVLAASLVGGLLAIAAGVAELDANRFQERYLLVVAPVAAVALALGWERGRRARLASAGIALALLVVAARVPISGRIGILDVTDSPTLWAARRLAIGLGSATAGAAVVLAAATALSLLAAAWALRRASSPIPVLAAAAVALGALSAGAHSLDGRITAIARDEGGGAPRDWIDRTGLDGVALLQPRASSRQEALRHLLWNRSADTVLLLRGARNPDPFGGQPVRPARDGRLLVAGRAWTGPLLVDTASASVELTGAERVAGVPRLTLWRPTGVPRLSLLAIGRHHDGWLAGEGEVALWPDGSGRTRGTLRLVLAALPGRPTTRVELRARRATTVVRVRGGERQKLAVPIDAVGPVRVRFTASPAVFDGRRFTTVRSSRPVFERR